MTGTEHPRSIRSFVTRGGRITSAQERALTALWRKDRVPLPLADVVCPQETPDGKARGVTCATCGFTT